VCRDVSDHIARAQQEDSHLWREKAQFVAAGQQARDIIGNNRCLA
jgi:hypothetical protein